MDAMNDAVIVEAVRTPVGIGKPEKGALSGIHPVDLSAHVIDALISRVGIEPENVDDVILGVRWSGRRTKLQHRAQRRAGRRAARVGYGGERRPSVWI